jgi:hypothetical protein
MSWLPMTSFLLPLSSPAMERLRLPKQKSPRCHTVSLLPTMEFQRRTSSASCSSIVANGRNSFVPEEVMIPRWPKCVSEMKKASDIYAPIHPYICTSKHLIAAIRESFAHTLPGALTKHDGMGAVHSLYSTSCMETPGWAPATHSLSTFAYT